MIQDVDETLRRLLVAELIKIPGCPVRDPEQVTFDPPTVAEATQDGEARINLYLHDLRENRDMREEGFYRKPGEQRDQMVGLQRPLVRIDLSYLVTAHVGDDPPTEHRLLSDALSVLLRWEAPAEAHLAGVLEGQGSNALLLAVAQPDHLAARDPSTLWQALGGRMRPSLNLVVTAPFDPHETKWTKAVREAVLALNQGTSGPQSSRPVQTSKTRVSIAGMVADQESARPVAGAEVTTEGREERTVTDERGFFHLENLPPGAYTLYFRKRGYAVEQRETSVSPGSPEQVEPMVIALRPLSDVERAQEEAALAAQARSASGLVEADRVYRVSLTGTLRLHDARRNEDRPAAFIPVRIGPQRTVTDADGVYCFFDLPPGEHVLLADLPGYGEIEVPADSAAASTRVIRLPGSDR